jgi:hypothetical protein
MPRYGFLFRIDLVVGANKQAALLPLDIRTSRLGFPYRSPTGQAKKWHTDESATTRD